MPFSRRLGRRLPFAYSGGGPAFPSTITPAFWLDGRLAAFSDAAGTVPANPPLGLVARASGSWLSPNTTDTRPYRDARSFCLEPLPTTGNYGGTNFNTPAGATLPGNASTLAFCFVSRFSPLVSSGCAKGLVYGADNVSGHQWGPFANNGQLIVYYDGNQWATGVTVPLGSVVAGVLRYSPTGLDLLYSIDGTLQPLITLSVAIVAGTIANITVGLIPAANDGFHGSISQIIGVARTVTTAEQSALLSWIAAQTPAAAFPSDVNFLAVGGDSIPAAYGLPSYLGYVFAAVPAFEAVGPQIKMLNLGVPSDNLAGALAKFNAVVAPLYSASRAKNIYIAPIGTNSIAFNGQTAAQNIAAYYTLLDAAKAVGFKVVAATILPRSDAGISGTFEADRQTFNTDVRTNYLAHAHALWDAAAVTNMGAVGDSNNATNYQGDHVHPSAAGNVLLLPTFKTAVLSLL